MFYFLVRWLLRIMCTVVFRMKVTGKDNIPRSGPVILASNHVSLLDPIVVGCAVDRRISFMAKHELFANRVFGTILKWLGAFPVRRGEADRKAFAQCFDVLRQGGVLGLFPEGTRSPDGRLMPAMSGTAIIATKTGAPVVPMAVIGTRRIWRKSAILPRPGRVEVRIGAPLYLGVAGGWGTGNGEGNDASLASIGERIMKAISSLMDDVGG